MFMQIYGRIKQKQLQSQGLKGNSRFILNKNKAQCLAVTELIKILSKLVLNRGCALQETKQKLEKTEF
jgi:hypothetical protein